MKILNRYIFDELIINFLATLGVLTFLLLIGNVFTKMIDLVLNRGVDIFRLLQIFIFSTPFLFAFTIPMAAMVAVLLTFGRLSADHEIVAMRASGVSLNKIIYPIWIAALVLSLTTLLLTDRLASKSHFKVREISSEIGLSTPTAALEEGVYIKTFKGIILFIHRIEENFLRKIYIFQPQEDGTTRTIFAEKGELIPLPEKNTIKLKLTDGTTDEPDKSNPGHFYKLKFGTYYLPLDMSALKMKGVLQKKRKEMTIRELWERFLVIKADGYIDNYLLTEINRKIAMSLSVFILTVVSIPLAIRTRRGEKSVGFAIALILGTVYWTAIIGMTTLSKTGTLPPHIAMHIPNVIMGILGLALTWKVTGR